VGRFLKYTKVIMTGLLGSLIAAASNGTEYLQGPNGRLCYVLQLPRNFDSARDKCPLVIVMHGVMAHKDVPPLPRIARKLVREGFAVLRFDFNAQGKSDGDVLKCTIPSEIADARAVYDYARSLPFVSSVVLLAHSQGGVVAGMLAGGLAGAEAGELAGGTLAGETAGGTVGEPSNKGIAPDALVLLAPGAVLKDYALEGRFLGVECDPVNPPEYVQVYWYKFSRDYIKTAQTLPIYEVSAQYQGPVCLIHGDEDKIVPLKYSEQYRDIYRDCEFTVIPRENHLFSRHPSRLDRLIIDYLHRRFLSE
jgi:alpha/beta superfamily hydrolase